MAEYIELEALLNRFEGIKIPDSIEYGLAVELAAQLIKAAPVDDVMPVVRCRDCVNQRKIWHVDNRRKDGGYYLFACSLNSDQFEAHAVNGRDSEFCSYGERRDSDAGE